MLLSLVVYISPVTLVQEILEGIYLEMVGIRSFTRGPVSVKCCLPYLLTLFAYHFQLSKHLSLYSVIGTWWYKDELDVIHQWATNKKVMILWSSSLEAYGKWRSRSFSCCIGDIMIGSLWHKEKIRMLLASLYQTSKTVVLKYFQTPIWNLLHKIDEGEVICL